MPAKAKGRLIGIDADINFGVLVAAGVARHHPQRRRLDVIRR
jgi:hypothetical protein